MGKDSFANMIRIITIFLLATFCSQSFVFGQVAVTDLILKSSVHVITCVTLPPNNTNSNQYVVNWAGYSQELEACNGQPIQQGHNQLVFNWSITQGTGILTANGPFATVEWTSSGPASLRLAIHGPGGPHRPAPPVVNDSTDAGSVNNTEDIIPDVYPCIFGDLSINVVSPSMGTATAQALHCQSDGANLYYLNSAGIESVTWKKTATNITVGTATPGANNDFALFVPDASANESYTAWPSSPCISMTGSQAVIPVAAGTNDRPGAAYGATTVQAGNNEGVVTLTDYAGTVLGWETSTDNGNSWQAVSATTDYIDYSNIRETTLYRARVNGCGGLAYSQSCTISIDELNWTKSIIYSADGAVVGGGITYFDALSRQVQNQSLNMAAGGKVLAQEPLYNSTDEVVGGTLAAPTGETEFFYKKLFNVNVEDPSTPYNYSDFDESTTISNPKPVGANGLGTLGWYYSSDNTLEPYTSVTGFPYTRSYSIADGSSLVTRSASPGDELRMGKSHEATSGTVPVRNELDLYNYIRSNFFPVNVVGAQASTTAGHATMTIVEGADGKKGVAIQNSDGQTLVSAVPAEASDSWFTSTSTIQLSLPYNYELQVPAGNIGQEWFDDLRVAGDNDINVYDEVGALLFAGPAGNYQSQGSFTFRRVESSGIFKLTFSRMISGANLVLSEELERISLASLGDHLFNFYLAPGWSTQITNADSQSDYQITHVSTGTDCTSEYQQAGILGPGYYKVVVLKGKVNVGVTSWFKDVSLAFYNQKGLLLGTLAPNGAQQVLASPGNYHSTASLPFYNENLYSTRGDLLSTQSIDEGKTEFVYRKDGSLRFKQNAIQRLDGKFSYINYDDVGRVIEVGMFAESTPSYYSSVKSSAILEATGTNSGLSTTGTRQDVVKIKYDLSDPPNGIPNREAGFLSARVAYTIKYSSYQPHLGTGDVVSKTWFSYNDQNKIQWLATQTEGEPIRTVDYKHDNNGVLVAKCYERDNIIDRISSYYGYSPSLQLSTVSTNSADFNDESIIKTEQARYKYYLHGPLKRTEYNYDQQGVDYTYTAQGWLKGINSADYAYDPGQDGLNGAMPKDFFGATFDYYTNDYSSRNAPSFVTNNSTSPMRYDGNIRATAWSTYGKSPNILKMYSYDYDYKNQLTQSSFGYSVHAGTAMRQYNFIPDAMGSFGRFNEGGISYDPNGNIKNMRRSNEKGNASMDASYSYSSGNQLGMVAATGTILSDFEYNDIGQTIRMHESGSVDKYFTYDNAGLITGIFLDDQHSQAVARYTYNESGFRVKQQIWPDPSVPSVSVTTTFVREQNGSLVASYEVDPRLGSFYALEQPIYGLGRLGVLRRQPLNEEAGVVPDQLYELYDNLGNVRIVFHRPVEHSYLASMETGQPTKSEEEEMFEFPIVDCNGKRPSTTKDSTEVGQEGATKIEAPDPGDDLLCDIRTTYVAHSGVRSAWLNASQKRPEGPRRVQQLYPGDQIHMEVFAYYVCGDGPIPGDGDPPKDRSLLPKGAKLMMGNTAISQNKSAEITPFWQRFAKHASATLSIPLGASTLNNQVPGGGVIVTNQPSAYIEYVIKDIEGNIVRSGSVPVSKNACGQWEQLKLEEIADDFGTIEVSLHSYNGVSVYFDDLRIDYKPGPVVQEKHYFAYGMQNDDLSWKRKDVTRYRYGYQGQDSEEDSIAGSNSFQLRLYSAKYGRWLNADPMRQYASPYVGMGNNPVNRIDPDGGEDHDYKTAVARHDAAVAAGRGGSIGDVYCSYDENVGVYEWGFNDADGADFGEIRDMDGSLLNWSASAEMAIGAALEEVSRKVKSRSIYGEYTNNRKTLFRDFERKMPRKISIGGVRVTSKWISGAVKTAKFAGRAFFVYGLYESYDKFSSGRGTGIELITDITFTAASLIPGAGWAIGASYALGIKPILQSYYPEQFKPDN